MKIKQWVSPVVFFFLLFHNNEDTTILAILVYSPRACFMGASHVLCCVVNVYGMQHLSSLSFTVEMSFLGYPTAERKEIKQTKHKLPCNSSMVDITFHKCQSGLGDLT